MFKKKKIKMTKKQLQLNKDLINNMINKIDNENFRQIQLIIRINPLLF